MSKCRYRGKCPYYRAGSDLCHGKPKARASGCEYFQDWLHPRQKPTQKWGRGSFEMSVRATLTPEGKTG